SAVKQLTPWIDKRLAEVARQRALLADRGDTLPYLGDTLTLIPEPGRTRVARRGAGLHVPADPEARAAALERWYRRQAAREIAPRLDAATRTLGVGYTRLTIRAQKTRWGSCSEKGAMSFNWRLLLGPADVLDYVVWHEACHRVHMDHSPRFWALLEEHFPGYREPKAWLRANGGTLVL
ncbi:MAG: M48 family metallopeptidase, partial [Solirubrobacterales bacterium]|nr:M48 family metallopeptidase [Solirubrobacterales bacterium]